MYRLLIVEDDLTIAEQIRQRAALWELEGTVVRDFRRVLETFAQVQPHLILLDLALPYFNGFHWCSEIRRHSNVPVLFLSSASDNMNIVMAMNLGADDFIVKPFDFDVLIAKIQALLRRSYDFAVNAPILAHRGAFLNTGDGTLRFGDETIPLTRNEFRILLCLLERKGAVVSRETLMEKLWKTEQFVDENTLTVNVNRLRKKLDAAGLPEFITTKFGVGYLVQ